jgi:hypothetical protein
MQADGEEQGSGGSPLATIRPSAPIAEQQDQYAPDHDQRTHQQVVLHGTNGLVHQFGPVYESVDVYTLGAVTMR